MLRPGIDDLSAEQRREIAAWFEAHQAELPESVRTFLAVHQRYLTAEGNLRKAFDAVQRELRRALHITPSSEKRRSSGAPLAELPPAEPGAPRTDREKVEQQIARSDRLAGWHRELRRRHRRRIAKLERRLEKMAATKADDAPGDKTMAHKPERLEAIELELTPEEIAADAAANKLFTQHLLEGDGPAPSLKSVNETLMPAGAVLESEERVQLPAVVPDDLTDARVVETLAEQRRRYDFAVSVTRIELEVEKKILEDADGARHVITASTAAYGPPRYAVTWDALATLAVLVAQFAMPFNRLGTLLSTPGKRFTAGALSRMLHYVAMRFLPVYLELASKLANAEILAGDDTSCRVLEVSSYFAKPPTEQPEQGGRPSTPPWGPYQSPQQAEESLRRCKEEREQRIRRRREGDRTAVPKPTETPSLGVLIGRKLTFESRRRDADVPKSAMHTTVLSGRALADDPRSLIIFYRSHLGSCGNLFEQILAHRNPSLRAVILQGDLSTSNLVKAPELLHRFDIRRVGCSSHARRPFALHEDEDVERCSYMLHLFLGLAMHESSLDEFGRNRDNVLAVRRNESRELWNEVLELARDMSDVWSKSTALGTAARYIIAHFDALTAYLDDPRLEPTNNLRERMLRMEKLIEGSSMFRRSLEGRFVLDIVRTVLQTAVAAGVPVHDYLVSVLRADPDEVESNPHRFVPHSWAAQPVDTSASLAERSTPATT